MQLSAQFRAAQAIEEVSRGRSLRSASKGYDVDRRYITRRIEGVPTREEVNEAQQKLSRVQEEGLAYWVIVQGQLGYAPPHSRFRLYAQRLLIHNGNPQRLGKGWVTRFLRRNPDIKTLKGTTINYKRLNGASPASTNVLFDRFELPAIKAIKWRNRFNADEIGMMEGMGENGLVLGEAFRKFVLLKDAFKRQWVTIIACVSADGRALLPLVIFNGGDVQQQWFPDFDDEAYESWYFTTLENGWTNTEIALQWLREVFIPNTKPKDPDEWRLLVIDGHNSHTTEDFIWMCLQNKIYVIFLPAHASHVFQPFDVGVFATLKRRFRYWFRERCYGRASEATDKTDFL
ncbi:hypothetical protein DL771_009966 [Monosporascus sp. 5C6A]|nr:hypothetical protein DL771_009966 [Monosporascus sp. 5C6A]